MLGGHSSGSKCRETYLNLRIGVNVDDQDGLDGVTSGSHISVELLHDALGDLGLRDEEVVEKDGRYSTTDRIVDISLDLASGVLERVEALVDLSGVNQVLYRDLELAEGVVLSLSLDADIERLQTQADDTDDGRSAAADAVETFWERFEFHMDKTAC